MFLVSWYIGLAYPANWLRSRPLIRYIMKIFDFFLPVGLHNIDAIKKLANKIIFSTFSRSNFKNSLSQTVIAVNFYPRKTFFKLFFETFFFDGPTSAAPKQRGSGASMSKKSNSLTKHSSMTILFADWGQNLPNSQHRVTISSRKGNVPNIYN